MVSIVLLTYNRADLVSRAVDGVLAQTVGDWELIIVDNGSTDRTQEVLAQYTDPRIRVYGLDSNRGAIAGGNAGLDHIRGAWFTCFNDDDEMVPDALEAMLDCAGRTGATAVTCNCMDTTTGALAGVGPTHDCRLSPRETSRLRGEQWGLTRTSLLGDLRFDERVYGGNPGILWTKINRNARRYYLHRALRIYHTEGTDRETLKLGRRGLREKVKDFHFLGEDADYLNALRAVDSRRYIKTMLRVWAARLLHPLLQAASVCGMRTRRLS